ncbi:glutathione S-transferase [Hypoxylon fragiforme]|uniref:glutathione S-transferase n=1 Tax=Hypoxylon fragiforme TaxID=63214 RepID=UPI0020C6EF0D|nr:glutathione S-transferase [Hypoxylon fragiforme]KAI2610140.1 glutathione S-transferase [Hypoxylon fragiforme]
MAEPSGLIAKNGIEPLSFAICPNGRMPVIVDHDRGGFAAFEGLAILSYLTRHYDPEHKFSFPVDSDDYSVAERWMAWQQGVGPMQGQANHFLRVAKEKVPSAVQRYVGETERLYGVLDKRLAGRDYAPGPGAGKYSIADISMVARTLPAVQKGFTVPITLSLSNGALREAREKDQEVRKKLDELDEFIRESKEKYGYKYSSP